jgi:toxin ParE1/3/4
MRVRWLRGALRNLHRALDYIAKDNPGAATEVGERIHEAAMQLEHHPFMGRPGRLKGTRELIVPRLPYVIRYRIQKETVEILRIHHMAQRWPEEG